MYKSLGPGAIGVRTDMAGAMRLAKEYGFDAIDLPIGEALRIAEAEGAGTVRRQFETAGLRPGSWGLSVDWRGDEEKFRQGLAELPRYAALAQQLGASRAATFVSPGHNERTRDQQWEYLRARFQPVARILADHGCRLGLEFIGPKTSRDRLAHVFLYTAGDMLAFAREIGPNVGLLHDCWHWYTSGGTLEELRGLHNEDIVAVHVNDAPPGIAVDEQIDNQRLLPLESGVIDLPGYLRALRAIGYDGPIGVEPFSARVRALPAEEAVAETKASLDRAWKEAGLR